MKWFFVPVMLVLRFAQLVIRGYLAHLRFTIPFTVGAVLGYKWGLYALAKSGGGYLYSWERYVPIAFALFFGLFLAIQVKELIDEIWGDAGGRGTNQ